MINFNDGFDSYASTSDLTKKWAANTGGAWTWNATAGRGGGGAVTASASGGLLQTPSVLTQTNGLADNNKALFGFYLKVSAAPGAVADILDINNGGGSNPVRIRINTSGQLTIYSTAGTLLLTGTTNVCDNNWHWVEFYAAVSVGADNTRCDVDGVTQWTNAAVSNGAAITGFTYVTLNSIASITITIDDFIIYDNFTAAPQVAQYPLGPREITTVRPTADNSVAFTRSSGSTNYSLINEVNGDGDSSYVQDGTVNDQDLYDYADLATGVANITAIVVNSYVENPNPGSATFQHAAKSGGSTSYGSTITAPTSYAVRQTSFPVDPATSAAWAVAAVNSAQFGQKVV